MKIKHLHTNKLDYDYIADGIYIGTNQCCQMHFDEKLKKEGIAVDISLEAERVDTPFGIDFYVWIPVKDHLAPTMEQLDFGVTILEKLVSLKKKVYVHCKNGHGRATTLVAAYFIKQGRSPDATVTFIKTKRPSIHLQDIQKNLLVEFSNAV